TDLPIIVFANFIDVLPIISMVEGRNYHHSNRLDATSRMVVVSSFYHHWMPRYSAKRQRIDYFIDVSPIISASSGVRRTKLLPSEPSRYNESNDSSFVEIISKTSKNRQFYRCFDDYFVIQ